MSLHHPGESRLAVNLGFDFDAHSLWMGTFDQTSPSYLSRGEYCAEVGVPRVQEVLNRHGIPVNWFVPTHTMLTFPEVFATILSREQDEIAAHGCWHEPIPRLESDQEVRLMAQMFNDFRRLVGRAPRGYRSPAWDFSPQTLAILEDNGVEWDSSLMGRDFQPYHPRPVTVGWESGNRWGEPSPVLEFPVSWYLDDFPAVEFVPGAQPGLGSAEEFFTRVRETFDYAYENVSGGILTVTFHPQVVGRPHMITRLDRLIAHMADHAGVYFTTLSDAYDTWKFEDPSSASSSFTHKRE